MEIEHAELPVPKEIKVLMGDHEIICLTQNSDVSDGQMSITVRDITNQQEIHDAVEDKIRKRYWFLDSRWEKEGLKERFRIKLGDHRVEIFAFGNLLEQQQKVMLIQTLERVHNSLKDKHLWTLESIQISAREEINPKNGQPFRGAEVPVQHRFELYPAGMTMNKYRGGELPCTELEGALLHELTHVILEQNLIPEWQSEDLGWRMTDNDLIELPGGSHTRFFNERPHECPTSYACLQQDDDRAESVVTYFSAPDKLDLKRREILDRFFEEPKREERAVMENLLPDFPEVPKQISLRIAERDTKMFKPGTITKEPERQIIPLKEFRKAHSIPEPEF